MILQVREWHQSTKSDTGVHKAEISAEISKLLKLVASTRGPRNPPVPPSFRLKSYESRVSLQLQSLPCVFRGCAYARLSAALVRA